MTDEDAQRPGREPTELQKQILGTIVILSRERKAAGEENPLRITTAMLSERLNRYGQPLGCSCGYMALYGWLVRTSPHTYALTRKGLEVVIEAYRGRINTLMGVPV
jgi:hypothetical protein